MSNVIQLNVSRKHNWEDISTHLWLQYGVDLPILADFNYEEAYNKVMKYVSGIKCGKKVIGKDYTVDRNYYDGYGFWRNDQGKLGEDNAIYIKDISQFVCCMVIHMAAGE